MREWIRISLRPDIRNRALKVALLIGTVLVLINQSGVILAGRVDGGIVLRCALTYLVPYLVSTHGSVAAIRGARRSYGR